MRVFESRASTVLYFFLRSNPMNKPFLLPANVCPIVPLTFQKANVNFEFVDIDYTHAMDVNKCIEKLKNKAYGGILFVHAYGRIFNNADFYKQVKNINSSIYIVDDKCLCLPRLNVDVCSNVDLELFSTGYAKYIELSYGGWGIINDSMNYTRDNLHYEESILQNTMKHVRYCLDHDQRYDSKSLDWLNGDRLKSSVNYLNDIESRFEEVKSQKQRINAIYKSNLPEDIQWGDEYNNWRFMISMSNRDNILQKILSAKLFAGTNFPSAAYLFGGIHLPNVENEQKKILNLFNDFRVNEDFAYMVCNVINASF